jgi:hypothetical protein
LVEDLRFSTRFSGTNFGALVDFYPFSYTWFLGGVRLSAGYYFGSLKLGFDAEATGIVAQLPDDFETDFELDPMTFELDFGFGGGLTSVTTDVLMVDSPITALSENPVSISSLKASPLLKLNARGPYLGIGWDMGLFLGLKMTFDAGVVFTQPHRMSLGLDFPEPSISQVLINIEGVGNQLFDQLWDAAEIKANDEFTICVNATICNEADRISTVNMALELLRDDLEEERDKAKFNLHNQILADLSGFDVLTNNEDSSIEGLNIVVDGNSALEAIGASDLINEARQEIYAERDKIISDFDKEAKDWGYFPMVRIGLIYRF